MENVVNRATGGASSPGMNAGASALALGEHRRIDNSEQYMLSYDTISFSYPPP